MIIIILLELEFRGQTVAHYHINGVNNLDLIACPLRLLLSLQLHRFLSAASLGAPSTWQITREIKTTYIIKKLI